MPIKHCSIVSKDTQSRHVTPKIIPSTLTSALLNHIVTSQERVRSSKMESWEIFGYLAETLQPISMAFHTHLSPPQKWTMRYLLLAAFLSYMIPNLPVIVD